MTKKSTPRITAVTFRANGPAKGQPFSHVHVEATATVPAHDSADDVLDALRDWVIGKVAESQEKRDQIARSVSLDRAIEEKRKEIERMEKLRAEVTR